MKMRVNENMAGGVITQRVPVHDPSLEKPGPQENGLNLQSIPFWCICPITWKGWGCTWRPCS